MNSETYHAAKGIPDVYGIFFVSSRQEGEKEFMDGEPNSGPKAIAFQDENRDSE
ncbi:hypothetical protein DesLBE_4021 [Desulfitobacterium sp. LBE]|uniref:hypothetical protein n=1 Tax=Desulfitobacterium sp. LBE TaxID=884086 RepID=UPI00119B6D6F|nr:hypothetical protein [Desulfitobacterium sp. LBE]TWH59625.1 hypothetical protein DesLBE_4021 [Desulfitobacterium sp. LBE]